MKVFRSLTDGRLRRAPRSVTIGIFDGVHCGHRKIVLRAIAEAKRLKVRSLVLTFDPHPVKILQPGHAHPILLSLPHRLRFLEALGVDETLVARFDRRLSIITREKFLDGILIRRLGMRALTVGHDFRFGRFGSGDENFLKVSAKLKGFHLSVVGALRQGGEIISSTRIRRLIEAGHLDKAGRMLGRPVSIYGTVVRGKGRGRELGFPTANLDPHHETLPPNGVYAVRGFHGGRRLKGVLHIGARPTFGESDKSLEVHFLNFRGNLYGQELEVAFVGPRIRPIRRFKNEKLLMLAIEKDVQKARKLLA